MMLIFVQFYIMLEYRIYHQKLIFALNPLWNLNKVQLGGNQCHFTVFLSFLSRAISLIFCHIWLLFFSSIRVNLQYKTGYFFDSFLAFFSTFFGNKSAILPSTKGFVWKISNFLVIFWAFFSLFLNFIFGGSPTFLPLELFKIKKKWILKKCEGILLRLKLASSRDP